MLGRKALQVRVRGFVLKPKTHSLHHVAYSIKVQLQQGHALILNPEVGATEVNEDYIGRVSRLSRRVGVRLCDERVIQRVFLKTRALQRKRQMARN